MAKAVKKISLLSCLLLIFVCTKTAAQSLRYSVALPYISLSAYTTKQLDPFSFAGNQAALAKIKTGGVGIYGERRFLLAENSVYGINAAIPTKKGNFGIQVNYSGIANYKEQKAGLAYAKSLGEKLDIGVQFNYYGFSVPNYINASTVNFEAGAIMHISDKLNAGVHVYNPVSAGLGKDKTEKLAAAYKFGLGYDISDDFYIASEILKEQNLPLNITSSFQYQFKKQFFVRAGFRSDNNTGFAGVGFLHKNLRIDLASSFHPQLGVSPGLLLIYNFKEAK
jgi:hypothetical protein